MGRKRVGSLLFGLALTGLAGSLWAQQQMTFIIIDGQAYQGAQLPWAARNPNQATAPFMNTEDWFVIHRSMDGHYWIPSYLNGHAINFMVDTGATKSFIGVRHAKNAGIRAGLKTKSFTANGIGEALETHGNKLRFGPFSFDDVPVTVGTNPANQELALLGMDVLKRFRILQEDNLLMLQPYR